MCIRDSWNAWGPRVQASWQVTNKLTAHAGAGITTIPPNIWQDNFLTGSTPFAVYPRLQSTSNAPIRYGFQITPAQIPATYTPQGANIFANGNPKSVAPNTAMDVNRYEQDMAALTPNGVVSALNLSGIDRSFGNGTLYTLSLIHISGCYGRRGAFQPGSERAAAQRPRLRHAASAGRGHDD